MVGEAFAMAPSTGGEGGNPASLVVSLIPLALMFAIFYFLLIRPQAKKQKAQQEMITNLKDGDNVLTSGGVYGTIVKIKDDIATLQVADNVRIKVAKSNISSLKGRK